MSNAIKVGFRFGFVSATAYKGELFSTMLGSALVTLLNVSLWRALYQQQDLIAGLNETQMLQYVICGWLLCIFYRSRVDLKLHQYFQTGGLGMELIRPQNLQIQMYIQSLGASFCRLIFSVLPIFFIVWVGLPELVEIPLHLMGCLMAFGLTAHALSFALSWCVGILGWYTQYGEGLIRVKQLCIISLGGALVPLPLYPDWVQGVALYLPFSSLSHIPSMQLMSGTVNYLMLVFPIFWTILLIFGGQILFRQSASRWVIQGG
jgi:ABC-2 type transport system permease protein